MERNALNYFFLIITILICIYFVIKYILFFVKFVLFKRVEAQITKVKVEKPAHVSGKYSFTVRYSMDGKIFESSLYGYSSPFDFNLLDKISICVNSKKPSEIMPANFKGQRINIFIKVTVIMLMFLSIIYCLELIGVVNVLGAKILVFVPTVFLLMAFVMLVHLLLMRHTLKKRMANTIGVVRDLVQVLDSEGENAYKPIVEFVHNNITFCFESEVFFYNTSKLGAKVKVAYFSTNPEFAEINSFESSWLEILFWLFLLLASCIALFIVL